MQSGDRLIERGLGGAMVDGWIVVDRLPELEEDEVQIWRADLRDAEESGRDFATVLSGEERTRAERLRAGQVRTQFVVARACLRVLLGGVLGVEPQAVAISQSRYGKPETAGTFFNVAHAGTGILIGLCRRHPVGVDLEYFSREVEALEIAGSSFSGREVAELSALSDPEELQRAFFRCWTRKEAVIKADGRGLSLPLDSFEVPVGRLAGGLAVNLSTEEGSGGGQPVSRPFFLNDVELGGNVAAAYAIRGSQCTARGFYVPLELMAGTP